MRILHIANYLPGHHKIWGGAEQITLRTIELLMQQGHESAAVTTLPSQNIKENFDVYPVKTLKDYFGLFLKAPFLFMKTCGALPDIFAFAGVNKILKKYKPDIIHFHKIEEFSISVLFAALINKIPAVMTIYDYFYLCPAETLTKNASDSCREFSGPKCIDCIASRKHFIFKSFFLSLRRKIFGFFLKKISAFIVLSESSSDILKSYGVKKEKIFVIRQPFLFESAAEPRAREGENTVLFIGWVQPRKGLHIAVEAMKDVVKEIKGAKLIAAGEISDKDYEQKIKGLIKNYGLENQVSILGKLPYDKVKELQDAASAVIVPEQWENMSPAVLIESMWRGKPVIASRIGGIPEFITDGEDGFLADPKDWRCFARKIIEVLKNKKKSGEIGKKAKEKIEALFAQGQTAGKLIGVYNEMVRR